MKSDVLKKLSFIFVIITMLHSCSIEKESNTVERINKVSLQDSTITSVYLGLELGMEKDSAINFLTNLQREGKIEDFKKLEASDLYYRCADIPHHGDTYHFDSKINIIKDSVYHQYNTSCTVDFYKDKLFSILIFPETVVFHDALRSEEVWEEINNLYKNTYGTEYTSSSIYGMAEHPERNIWKYSCEIRNYFSWTSENTIWTASNVQIILGNRKIKFKIDEYEERAFNRICNLYPFIDDATLIRKIESEVGVVNSRYKYYDNYFIAYKDVILDNEIKRIKQIAIDEENRIKKENERKRKREQEIEDSIKQKKIKEEYKNQFI